VPFEVKVESEALLRQFEDVQKRVEGLDQKLPDVFLQWQRDDMKRSYPNISAHNTLSVTTHVYPRSRRVRVSKSRSGGGKKQPRRQGRRLGSKRPILRPELVVKLFARMSAMCREAIQWQ
jgi:hypothetical protein